MKLMLQDCSRGTIAWLRDARLPLVVVAIILFAGCSHKEELARLKAEARQAETAGDHQKAIARWTSVVKLDPKSGEARLERATLYQTVGKWTEAIADYSAYLRLPPWRPGLKERLAMRLGQYQYVAPGSQVERWFVLSQRAYVYAKLGQFEKAEADSNEAIGLEPKTAMLQVWRAQIFEMKGDSIAALKSLDPAVEVAPEEAAGYTYRGAFLMHRGSITNAVMDLDKALQLEPEDTRALMNRGLAYSRQGEVDKALADLDKAVKSSPQEPDVYTCRGMVLMQVGEYNEALDDFNSVLIYRPNDPKAIAQRGVALTQKGELALGLADLTEALRLNPAEPYFYAWRASALIETNQFEKALQDINHAIEANPNETAFYQERARVYSKQHKYREAFSDMEHCLSRNPGNFQSCNAMAWLRATCPDASFRNGTEAVKLATQACEVTRFGLWAAVDTLAAAYAETGDFEHAVQYQKQALDSVGVPEKQRARMAKRLELYEQKKAFREDG
jgi:tetratricopeptide (TPR) repeat protein